VRARGHGKYMAYLVPLERVYTDMTRRTNVRPTK